jgi:hypothetical protein
MITARRMVFYGLLIGFASLLATSFPDIRRYVKITRM